MITHEEFDYPLSLDVSECINKFAYIQKNYNHIKFAITNLHDLYNKGISEFRIHIDNLLFNLPIYNPIHLEYLINSKTEEIARILYTHYERDNYYLYEEKNTEVINKLIYEEGSIKKYFETDIDVIKTNIVQLISYILTNQKDSIYNYGLSEHIFNESYCLMKSVKWIIENISKEDINCSCFRRNK